MSTTAPAAAPTAVPFMEPVLRRGRSALDRELLPGDENEARLAALLDRAEERGAVGIVVFGAAHTPENLVYYANYTPTTFHGALVARRGEPPVLFAGKGGARDHPYIRTLSWVADIRFAADVGQAIQELTGVWGSGPGKLGVAGMDTSLPHHVGDGVVAALGERIVPVDDLVTEQRRRKSAREVEVLRRARDLAVRAAAAAVAAAGSGAGRRTALAAADYAARAGGAHDCRITAGTSGGVATMSEVPADEGPVRAVVSVEYLGYWGLAALRIGGDAADASDLVRVVAGLRPGVSCREVVALQAERDDASYIINGIGCAPAEAPQWREPADPVVEGDVLAVVRERRGPHGLEFDVRTVVVTPDGARDL